MKRLLMAMVLTCAFACSISAGDIPTDGSPAPSSNSEAATINSTSPGDDIPISGKSDLSSEALSALLSALSFLGI